VLRNLADLSLRLEEYPMVGLFAQKSLEKLETAPVSPSEALQGRLLLLDMWGSALEALGQKEKALEKSELVVDLWKKQPRLAEGVLYMFLDSIR
jgi:hypothetical protein